MKRPLRQPEKSKDAYRARHRTRDEVLRVTWSR